MLMRSEPAFPLWKEIECDYITVVLFSAQGYFPEGQPIGNFAVEAAKGMFDRARDQPYTEGYGKRKTLVPNVYGLAEVDLCALELGPFAYVGFVSGDDPEYGSYWTGFVSNEKYQTRVDETQVWIDNGRPHNIGGQWYHRFGPGKYEITDSIVRPA